MSNKIMDFIYECRFRLEGIRVGLMAKFRKKEMDHLIRWRVENAQVRALKNGTPQDKELAKYIIKNRHLQMLVFPGQEKYRNMKIEVLYDDEHDMRYVMFHGKKLYMKKNMNEDDIVACMRAIYEEQDDMSPHKYIYNEDDVKDKIVADIGAAEGFWSLDVIDFVKKVYIFEIDKDWCKALNLTFAPYKDKVELVEKLVDSEDSAEATTLDSFFYGKKLDIIKADIEGYEMAMLHGGRKVLDGVKKLLICVYHRKIDEQDIRNELGRYGFRLSTTAGYVFNRDINDWRPETIAFKHGVIIADNSE